MPLLPLVSLVLTQGTTNTEAPLWRGNPALRQVALTFDDGPDPAATPLILDALRAERAKAGFFIVGERVHAHPNLLRQMLDGGHEIGNHTHTHRYLTRLSGQELRWEIGRCEDAIVKATGRRATLLRPPGMRYTERDLGFAREKGYTLVGWTVGAKDFFVSPERLARAPERLRGIPTPTADAVVERVLRGVHPGAIVLLHENPVTAAALPEILGGLRERGYEVVSLSELAARLPRPVALEANPLAASGH